MKGQKTTFIYEGFMTLTHVLTLVGCILAYFPSKLVRLKEEEAADASHFIATEPSL